MTPAQLDNARAVREELQLMFDTAASLTAAEAALAVHCELAGVPHVNGDLCAKLGAALMAIAEAMDAYDLVCASPVTAAAITCAASVAAPAPELEAA